MAKHEIRCPMCGDTLAADSQKEMIKIIQDHASKTHQSKMSEEDARKLIVKQEKAT